RSAVSRGYYCLTDRFLRRSPTQATSVAAATTRMPAFVKPLSSVKGEVWRMGTCTPKAALTNVNGNSSTTRHYEF
ncbi:MAG: hypothetical protein ABSD99_12520, partial [Candidatus Bathyarchaeia archaeon]